MIHQPEDPEDEGHPFAKPDLAVKEIRESIYTANSS